MIAEVISIGDELTSGERLDTNSQWLSQRLAEIGIAVRYHTTVADDLEANVGVFRAACERADLVIASGGLGPTADDLTRDVLARVTSTELVLDQGALAHIRGLFARRKREMPERNVVQAMFPAGSRVVPNPHGTAPGIDLFVPRSGREPCRLFALPGVPAEMFEMWEATLRPALVSLLGNPRVIRHRRIKCFGVGESDLEARLPDLIRRGRVPSVGITVSEATITLRITAQGDSPEACLQAMEPTVQSIHECLGTLVYGEEDDELQHAVLRLLRERGATLATAEWGPHAAGTSGLLAQWLGEDELARGVLASAVVVSSAKSAATLLGAPWSELESLTATSAEACRILAETCRARSDTDYALAIGGFPAFVPEAQEPARLHLALATREGVSVHSTPFAGHPAILKPRAVKQGLNLLRLHLLGQAPLL